MGEVLAGDRDLLRVYYYNAPLDFNKDKEKYAKQQRFFKEKIIIEDWVRRPPA